MSASNHAGSKTDKGQESMRLMEQIVSRENIAKAYKRVVKNKGSSGVDGLSTEDLKDHLTMHWSQIKERLLGSGYYPSPVKRVTIPKPGGGERILGIPTVLDRLIQQAIHQVLQPLYDPFFSEWSFGFRPGRSTHQAIERSKSHIREGKRWVVDMDLSKFFDEVHHERLLNKLRIKIKDRRVIHLISRYLKSGIMMGGMSTARTKGTPQGSPLSPLLSNIVLDELDKELESRGHQFVRYADDFQIYVGSKRSAERIMTSLTRFIENRLKLKVNLMKSAIARPWQRSFLGYGFTHHKESKLRVAKSSVSRFKAKLKEQFRSGRGQNIGKFINKTLNPILRGWIIYFSRSEVKGFAGELDSWIRRHLRKIKWRQMKRSWTRYKEMLKRGLSESRSVQSCFNQRGPWWNSGASHMNRAYPRSYFDQIGLLNLRNEWCRYHL